MFVRGFRAQWALITIAACLLATRATAQQDSVAMPAPTLDLTFRVHGYIQVYYRAGDPLIKDGFRLRKSDLKFDGDVSPRLKWRVTFDAAKLLTLNTKVSEIGDSLALSEAAVDQRSKLLQDAALTYFINKNLNFDIGQQVLPMSLEGKISSSQVETIERNLFTGERSRAVGLADVRDIGLTANGFALNTIEFHAGVFNETGDAAGTTDANQQKAFIGRVSIHPPFIPALQFGATGGYEGGAPTAQRRRGGTEVQFRVPLFTLRAESMSARDGNLQRFGWYGLGALRPTSNIQLVARYDSWDRDLSHDVSIVDAYERQAVIGGSYSLDQVTRISINVVRQTFPNVSSLRAGTFVLTAFQASW